MQKLVEWADVLCENFKPGTLDKFGYDYETCSGWNPALIYTTNVRTQATCRCL